MSENQVDFGFSKVLESEKATKVKQVFDSVANDYDIMNDAMSLGMHHLWKRYAVAKGLVNNGDWVLDLAAGTGDLTRLWLELVASNGKVVMSDINAQMLISGMHKIIDSGNWGQVDFVQTDAEALPFANNLFDCISIGFGLRNMTHQSLALQESYRVLKPGGRLVVLEFSHPDNKIIANLYDKYSFDIIPKLGELIAKDKQSYNYLVESIRKHPTSSQLKTKFLKAGFDVCTVDRICFGVVAVHCGVKY